jgi:endonuclease/exonuclease/phosphatase family metal-dependent hydrolase
MSSFLPVLHRVPSRVAAAALLLACAGPGLAQEPASSRVAVYVAAFNMAWAGTMDDFQRHLQVCSAPKVNWCDTRARWAPGTTTAPPEEVARAQACEAATIEAAGGREASMQVVPCNAYRSGQPRIPGAPAPDPAAVRRSEAYQGKLDGLRATVEALIDRDQVRVIAFQEVRSAEAVRVVLGRHADRFEVCAAQHGGFQSLAFAWDKTLSSSPGRCTTHAPLAVLDPPNDLAAFRRVRPGLALQLAVNGEPVTFMNVHLKAGCASATNSNPRFPARLLTDAVEPCETFNRQVPILESWIDAVAAQTPRFVILGDFNRRIDEEVTLAIPRDQVRANGANPSGPPTPGADGRVATRYLWPELADGTRALHLLPLKGKDAACTGFVGLDHIVVSGRLQALLDAAGAAESGARKAPVVNRPGQPIESSDHCPQVGRLLF